MNPEHQPQETESAASIGEKRSESFLSAFRGKYLQPFDKGFRSASRSLLVIFVFVFFVRAFVMEATVIPTASMEKTILIGDHIFLNKLLYGPRIPFTSLRFPAVRKIRRQQIVAFHYPRNPSAMFVKRVIGVGGDRLRIVRKKVYIHDTPLGEPYVYFQQESIFPLRDNFPPTPEELRSLPASTGLDPQWSHELPRYLEGGVFIVPAGHYFVMGDNRDTSLDSRFWGLVPEEYIVGEPVFVYWSYDAPTEDWVTRDWGERIKFDLSIIKNFISRTRWSRTGKPL